MRRKSSVEWDDGGMGESGLERVVAVDWSGRVDAAGQRRHIWAGVWTASGSGGVFSLEAGRTREELIGWLIEMARETPRMVVSVDCCFSFPAWFLEEHGCGTVFEFWRRVAAGQGERWLARECEEVARDERFWGAPHKRPEQFCGPGLARSMRSTDMENKITPKMLEGDPERAAKVKGITPKSPFQIGGSGSVGTGSLRAMPFLLALWEAGFTVWPFESSGLGDTKPKPLLVEMYTRLMTGAVAKSNEVARRAYLVAKKKSDAAYAELGRGVLAKAYASEDAFDALVSVVEMVRYREEFAGLKATKDKMLWLEGITWRPGIGTE
ncbi:hypothetical protein EDE15_3198 [Edaphobacter aggregans]|uniref:DUF429 domain-containing protein n=1 Tax=Edaphobacter aggregans TaxID=570835 RepID=A0A3R9NZS9_9BACT|nr:hypothetical protein [Edaphobacter aggregans]RSL17662.1 hypothetical protein EDE15_3198 [Edaphobacter aggregans]